MQKRFSSLRLPAAAAAAIVAILGSGSTADAAPKSYIAVLNAGQEVPPLAQPGVGNAFLRHDSKTGQICWTISYVGLAGNETTTHIHGPAAPGEDAAVVFEISPTISPLGSGKQGCAPLDAAAAKALKKGLLYINVHSDAGPAEMAGELRGQIIPVKGK